MAVVLTAIILPVVVYVVMSSEWASTELRKVGEDQLSQLLGTEVVINDVDFSPFNTLTATGVSVKDDNDSTALTVKEISTRFEFIDLIWRRKIIIDYATVTGLDLKLYKDSINAPLNIDNIVKRLSNPDKENKETIFALRLNDVRLTDCSLSYDVWSVPVTPGKFNKSHIGVTQLSLTAFAPIVSNDHYRISLRSMGLCEQSGFCVSDLSARAELTNESVSLKELKFEMPNSSLSFGDLVMPIDSIKAIGQALKTDTLSVALNDDSHIYLPDLKAFVPLLGDLDYNMMVGLDADISNDWIYIRELSLSDLDGIFNLNLSGQLSDYADRERLSYHDLTFDVITDTVAINDVLSGAHAKVTPQLRSILSGLGRTSVKGYADGTLQSGRFNIVADSRMAKAKLDGTVALSSGSGMYSVNGKARIDSLRLNHLLNNKDLGSLTADIDISAIVGNKTFAGDIKSDVHNIAYKGYSYRDISLDVTADHDNLLADVRVNDPNLNLTVNADAQKVNDSFYVHSDIDVRRLRLDTLNITHKYPGYNLRGHIKADAEGYSIDKFKGTVDIDNVSFVNSEGGGIKMDNFYVTADNISSSGRIVIDSDFINGTVDGDYKLSTIKSDFNQLFASLLPSLSSNPKDEDVNVGDAAASGNNFVVNLTLTDCNRLFRFLNIPLAPVEESEVVINSTFNSAKRYFYFKADLPWLESGGSLLQNTSLVVDVNGSDNVNANDYVYLYSFIPTKKGDMDVDVNVGIKDGSLDTKINWRLDREKNISGIIAFDTSFTRDADGQLITTVGIKPGSINFGNEIWNISQSQLQYGKNRITVNNLRLDTYVQSLYINGVAGEYDTDVLNVNLDRIELINIFETLDIDKALISGYATGMIEGRALLSKNPVVKCDNLDVKSIGYNYCTIGDASVALSLDDGGKVFNFAAKIAQQGGYKSVINGFIVPATEEIEINFDANHVPVGFMKPFMEAFTSDVYGYGTGKARLYGTFKDIDMTGDIYVEDLHLKIDFTDTWYHTTDWIKIEPGIIRLNNIAILDKYDHKALLNGYVAHKYFHDASFDFKITNAEDFLCYDVKENPEQNWFGTIFGNGTATIVGEPGVVNIGAEMETAKGSKFTFIISDREDADEYSFITFRDVTPKEVPDSILHKKTIPAKILASNNNTAEDETPTAYNMKITVGITPVAELTVVMDPIGGDKIVASGEGSIQMIYASKDNDLKLRGTYSILSGNYNFTLQDIIRKDFTITSGKIKFNGDPYAAYLDNVEAFFETKGNLSDLDESFLQDRDLNNTLVRVHAVMNVSGDIRQIDKPKFRLEFPTLNQDIERKVNSILSAEDMISQQIFYLLALGKFYTPEYMASATKGNELFAVASSTLSSQLSNVLGKLSDNWSIAPNLRSNRGDFSDFEIDVALRSSLLNNRLLLNGNFGYRDKSLNTNQFIGDFDAEYLLRRNGEWRLKAYNRYNDQNYYLRSAATTQGIGIVYRKDFDKTLRFLSKMFRKNQAEPDSTIIDITDSLSIVMPVDTLLPATIADSIGIVSTVKP